MSHHECIGGENGSGNGRGSVNGKEGADCGELAADFLFLNVEKTSDVLNHLFMRESQFVVSWTIRRRGSDQIGSVASTVNGRGRARQNEDGGGRARHRWNGWAVVWSVEGKEVVCMIDAKGTVDWRSFCKVLKSQCEVGDENRLKDFNGLFYTVDRPAIAEFVNMKSANASGACRSL